MNPKNETRTTALFQELDEISKGQKSYTTFLNHQKNEQNYLSLKDYIDDYFFQHPDITPSVIIQDSNLSRNYVYPICNGTKHPTKYKLVAFCIGAFRPIFSPNRISRKKSDGRYPVGLVKNSFWKKQNGKRKIGCGAWLWKISEYIGICFLSANTP